MHNTLKIIIAEDDDHFGMLLKNNLEKESYFDVECICNNGHDTVASVKKYMPDVLLLDLIMPGADGYWVLENLFLQAIVPKLIIVISQVKCRAFIERALSLGANYYMRKPIDFDILKNRILEFTEVSATCSDTRVDSRYINNRENFSQNDFNTIDLTRINQGMNNYKNYQISESKNEYIEKNKKSNIRSDYPNTQLIREKQKTSVDEKISNLFISVGIPAHIKGYQFLREAIKLAINDPEIINCITKKLYPGVATKYETTPSKVERAIRHAIEVAWNRGKIENLNSIFGIKIYTGGEKPTNGEFIALIADKMLLEGA